MNSKGSFIVIEGTDGSGKETQFRLLKERLTAVGYELEVFDFPQYDKDSSYFVRQYLNGRYGPAKDISPYTASLFYALDRYEAAPRIRQALEDGKVVLANRFVGSNMAHQGGKFEDPIEQRSFFVWEDSLEYQLLNIPRPSINIVLRVPAETAQELVAKKNARSYTDKSHDEHEADLEHLKKSVETYDLLCKLFPNDFKRIDCVENNELSSIPDINNKIWEIVRPMLPDHPQLPAHSVVVRLHENDSKKTEKAEKPADNKPAAKPEFSEKLSLFAYYEALLAGLKLDPASKAWHKNNYEYHRPADLPKKTLARYDELFSDITEAYKAVKAKLGKDNEKYLLAMTPLAALTQTKSTLDAAALRSAIRKLSLSENKEVIGLAEKLNSLGRKLEPKNFEATLEISSGKGPESINKILARLAAEHLPQNLPTKPEPIVLMEVSPRNEFNILADTIYPFSSLPKAEIEEEVSGWSYQQKSEALEQAIRSGAHEVLDNFTYQFDITADRLSLEHIIASGLAADVKVQPATPRFGYDVPEELEDVGATDDFLNAFDKSLELFSALQASGREDLAPYATLAGHKVRFQLTCSLDSINTRLKSQNTPEVTKLINAMIEQIAGRHPVAIAGLVKGHIPSAKSEKKPETQPEKKAVPKQEPKKSGSKPKSRRHRGGKSKK